MNDHRSPEIDADAFFGFGVVDHEPAPAPERAPEGTLAAAHEEAERRLLETMASGAAAVGAAIGVDLLGPIAAPATLTAGAESKEAARLIGLIYESSRGSTPHIVTIRTEGPLRAVTCTCKAAIFNLPRGCWAMVDARRVLGLAPQE